MSAKIISVVSPKGGAGKSTLALCLAHAKPFSRLRVALLEADAQGSLSGWQSERKQEGRTIRAPVHTHHTSNGLADALQALAETCDLVVLDCPGESIAAIKTRVALVYSDIVVIPIRQSEFDQASVAAHVLPMIEPARDASTRETRYCLLPVMVHHAASMERAIAAYDGTTCEVLPTVLTYRKVYADFPTGGLTLADYAEEAQPRSQRKHAKRAMGEVDAVAAMLRDML